MSDVSTTTGQDLPESRFLTQERVARVGGLIAPMLAANLSWIERRKESVEILDDTALRRQISVDFSLRRSSSDPLLEAESGDELALHCAPLFVLPKRSGRLMAFDLTDREGASLRLVSRVDNAEISAATLIRMVRHTLDAKELALPDELGTRLADLARSENVATAELTARRIVAGRLDPWSDVLEAIRGNPRLCWWIETFAHSSIVVVLYRSPGPRRQLIKLRYEEAINSEVRVRTRLGWRPYAVAIDSPLIEARSYHFEATAPRGLRIAEARLSDTAGNTVREHGYLRRIHLYNYPAEQSGAGTAILRLAVSGTGFVGGAVLAASLIVVALLTCAIFAPNIAGNPTSAPALLLVLPGLIASYIGRPDQHALTTRLLAFARWALLASAFYAYVAAAKVALSGAAAKNKGIGPRTDSLRLWLYPLSALAFLSLVVLSITFVRARFRLHHLRDVLFSNRVVTARCLPIGRHDLFEHLRGQSEPSVAPSGYEVAEDNRDRLIRFERETLLGARFVTCELEDADGDSVLRVTTDFLNWMPGQPVLPRLTRRASEDTELRLDALEAWISRQNPTDQSRSSATDTPSA